MQQLSFPKWKMGCVVMCLRLHDSNDRGSATSQGVMRTGDDSILIGPMRSFSDVIEKYKIIHVDFLRIQ